MKFSFGLITCSKNFKMAIFERCFKFLPWRNFTRSRTNPKKIWWKKFHNPRYYHPSKFRHKKGCSWCTNCAVTKIFTPFYQRLLLNKWWFIKSMKLINSKRKIETFSFDCLELISRTPPQIQPQVDQIWIEPHSKTQNRKWNSRVAFMPTR